MDISLVPFRQTPYDLQFLFADKMFSWQQTVLLPNTTPVNYLITSPVDQMIHFIKREILIKTGTSSTLFSLYASPNATLNVPFTNIFNVNLSSTYVTTLSIGTSTTIAVGTLLETAFLGFGRTIHQGSEELILKKNTKYLLRFNTTTPPAELSVNYIWYESNN